MTKTGSYREPINCGHESSVGRFIGAGQHLLIKENLRTARKKGPMVSTVVISDRKRVIGQFKTESIVKREISVDCY